MNAGKNTIPDISANVLRAEKNNGCVCSEKSDNRSCDKLEIFRFCCIRATVTDAFYLNYNPYVIRECVATNSETVNEVHLTDIDKYLGKVIDMNTFSKMLEEGQL